jgi:hypothetical protein
MSRTMPHTDQIFKLNGERVTRTYTSEVVNVVEQGENKSYSAVTVVFDLTFYGMDQQGLLNYRVEVKKRFLLNEKFNIIRNPDKAQRMALKVAAINDVLELKVDKSFKLNKIVNTQEIRQKWKEVKIDLLEEHPDLHTTASDLDWQLQENNIQQVFLEDNFYQFFFSNIFYQEFNNKTMIQQLKTVSNALGTISIPIIEQKKITKQDIEFSKVTIMANAKMDTDHKNFPLYKLNTFLGKLPAQPNKNLALDFDYNTIYSVLPQIGLVKKGSLEYYFEVKDLYKKTTTITFNLEKNE